MSAPTRRAARRLTPLFGLLLAPAMAIAAEADAPAKGALDFGRDIRPILSDKCFACHGPDAGQRKAGLRLDNAEGAAKGGESGARTIVPGKPGESELVARITSSDADEVMPPKKHRKPLTPAEVAKLTQWVAEGGSYRQHWAFIAPVRPGLPKVGRPEWVRNPIDAFILARLEKDRLKPSPEADRSTLLRRLSLDLIGLPPTPAELDAFLADNSPDAYEKQVDRLLKSPHYGERWGRVWLDAARYADSDGYEKDKPRFVWAYRDWVINALNRDLPYDQFIIDQVAGDLVPGATQDQKVATGFLRNSMINEEGGVDPEQFRMEAMFDRMDAIGKGVLGLTIQCAQCHSHKYDPITQDDYYRMFAFLNNSHEANIPVYSPEAQKRRADLFRQVKEIEAELQHRNPDWPERMAEWERQAKADLPEWVVVRPEVDDISTGGQKYLPMPDGSLLAQGYAPTKHTVKMTVKTDLPEIAAVRLELLNDADLPLGGPGRSIKGTGALTEFMIDAAPADEPGKTERVKIFTATSDSEMPVSPLDPIHDDKSGKKRIVGPARFAIDGDGLTAWGHDFGPGRRNLPRKAVFSFEAPIRHEKGTILTFSLQQNHGGWNSDDNQNCNLGRFRLSLTNTPKAEADPLPKAVREALAIPAEARNPAQVATIFGHWRTSVPAWKAENDRIEGLWRSHPEGSSQLILTDREDPRETFVLERGDFLKPKRPIGPGVPGFLHPLPSGEPANRLAFARWLVARESPTTARSLVNRAWQGFFGTGIVATSEDLGSQAEAPSHPELLDWLAVEFMDKGWSQKALHRLIVTSATYRQASRITPELQTRDPYNRLLARGPRFRVDAEVVRDIALAASGRLDPTIGGPSVCPPAPEFLFQPPTSYGPKPWKPIGPTDGSRRAIYTFRFRSVPYPALQAFDAPNGDFACVRRARSNTPLQALTTLNEPVFLDCARALALRVLKEAGDSDEARVAYAFRLCLGRAPTRSESEVVAGLVRSQAERFSKPDAKPWDLAASDPAKPPALPKGATPAQLAAWTAVGRVLLNLDETITKE
jgi:mono/diheme cytochrome c family protein